MEHNPENRIEIRAKQSLENQNTIQPSDSAQNILKQAFNYIALQKESMECTSFDGLRFFAVNRTREILHYNYAVLFEDGGDKKYRVTAVSSVSNIEKNAPFITWSESIIKIVRQKINDKKPIVINRESVPVEIQRDWNEYVDKNILVLPLYTPEFRCIGYLWFSREQEFTEKDTLLTEPIASSYAYIWGYLMGGSNPRKQIRKKLRITLSIAGIAFLILMIFPIRMNALSSAEIIAEEPNLASAPMSGVIKDIFVTPNQYVKKGDPLYQFEDTTIRGEYELAKRGLSVAEEKLRTTGQQALSDQKAKAEVALLEVEKLKYQAQLIYQKNLLKYITVRAESDGITIFNNRNDWIGKPVEVGERVMAIANPEKVNVRVDLAVSDDMVLKKNAKFKLFLNASPLKANKGKIAYYASTATQSGKGEGMVYELIGELNPKEKIPRIGAKGMARVYGNYVPFGYYLLRRPISVLRRWLSLY